MGNLVAVYGTLRQGQRANSLMKSEPLAVARFNHRCFYRHDFDDVQQLPEFYANSDYRSSYTFVLAAPTHASYPAIVPVSTPLVNEWEKKNNQKYSIELEIYNVDNETLASLDRYEGYPHLYIKGGVDFNENVVVPKDETSRKFLFEDINKYRSAILVYIMNLPKDQVNNMHFIASGSWLDFDPSRSTPVSALEDCYNTARPVKNPTSDVDLDDLQRMTSERIRQIMNTYRPRRTGTQILWNDMMANRTTDEDTNWVQPNEQ